MSVYRVNDHLFVTTKFDVAIIAPRDEQVALHAAMIITRLVTPSDDGDVPAALLRDSDLLAL